MKVTAQQQSREEMAWEEVGHTDIRSGAAWALSLAFLCVIYAVPIHQHVQEWREAKTQHTAYKPVSLELLQNIPETVKPIREHGIRLAAILDANRIFLRNINEYEDRLEDESWLGQRIRPTMQTLFSRWLGVGNEQAYIGRDGWLFYRPGMDYLTGPGFLDRRQIERRAATGTEWRAAPQPDPRKAILDFKRQLDQRGITLIVMPAPVKPSVHPEQFSARYPETTPALHNKSYPTLLAELEAERVIIFDPSDLLVQRKKTDNIPQHLATDTHWRPEAMEAAAKRLADIIGRQPAGGMPLHRHPVEHTAPGDIALMLKLRKDQTVFPPEPVTIHQVFSSDGQFWRHSEEAEILVLGDSFSNIYSLEPMGWGESAGFIEQLSFFLGAPIDRIVRNDSGAFATRDMLSRELARGRDRLTGKRVVVWQFAARELAVGDWRIIPMKLRDPPEMRSFVPEPEQTVQVRGVVQEVSAAPRPGTVPYRDHIVSIHLVELPEDGQAVVYMHSMVDNEWTRAARLRPGEEITVHLRPWADVAGQYDGINRSELDDFELQLQEPCWGEWP